MTTIKLLHKFGSDKRYTSGALFTTFTFDPIFFEGFMFRTLSNRGASSNTVIIIDGRNYNKMFTEENYRRATGAGKFYSLVPAHTETSFFHPKIYLFTSKKLLQCYIGSYNLTETGFMTNLELSRYVELNKLKEDTYITAPFFQDIYMFFIFLLESNIIKGLSDSSKKKIENILSAMNWITDIKPQNEIFPYKFISNLEQSIYNQIIKFIEFDVKKVKILGPEFGDTIDVLKTINKTYPKAEIQIYIKQNETSINTELLKEFFKLKNSIRLIKINPPHNRKIHAKYYCFNGDKEKIIFYGSANPSRKGFLLSYRNDGNIEVGIIEKYETEKGIELLNDEEFIGEINDISINDFISPYLKEEKQKEESEEYSSIILFNAEFKENLLLQLKFNLELSRISSVNIQAVNQTDEKNVKIPIDIRKLRINNDLISINVKLSEDLKKFLKNPSMVQIKVQTSNEKTILSNWVWLDIYSESMDEKIKHAIMDSGITFVPNSIVDLFSNENGMKEDLLNSLIQIEKGIHLETGIDQQLTTKPSKRRTVVPPDYSKTRKTGRNISSILENFLNIYTFNLKRLLSSSEEKIDSIIEDFSSFLIVILQVSIAMILISKSITNKKIEEEINNCKQVVRGAISDIARPSLIQQLLSLIDRSEIEDKENLITTYLKEQFMLQLIYTNIFLRKYDKHYFKYMDQGRFNELFCLFFDTEDNIFNTFYSIDSLEIPFYDQAEILLSPVSKKPDLIPNRLDFTIAKRNLEELLVLSLSKKGISGIIDYINKIEIDIKSIDNKIDLNPYYYISGKLSYFLNNWGKIAKKALIRDLDMKIKDWKIKGFDQNKIKIIEYVKPDK